MIAAIPSIEAEPVVETAVQGLSRFVELLLPDDQQRFQELNSEFHLLGRRSAQQMHRMGCICQEMRQLLPDGPYGEWLASYGMNIKTVNAWINVVKTFNSSEVQNFIPTALTLLGGPSVPDEAREEAKAIAQSGQVVDMATARQIKDKYQNPAERYEAIRIQYREAGFDDLVRTGSKNFKYQALTLGRGWSFRGLDEAERSLEGLKADLAQVKAYYATAADSTAMPPATFVPSFGTASEDAIASTAASPTGYVTSADPNPFAESIPAAKPSPQEHARSVMTSAKTDQHLTPDEVKPAILGTFGGVLDLDPCSNSHHSPNIPAKNHFTAEDNGLEHDWFGFGYSNPPYSVRVLDSEGNPIPLRDEMTGRIRLDRSGRMVYKTKSVIRAWTEKLIQQIHAGNISGWQHLVKNDPSTEWFRLIWENAQAVCFADYRLAFKNDDNEGNAAPFTTAIAYFGDDVNSFAKNWRPFGVVVTEWNFEDEKGVVNRRSWDEVCGCLAPF